MNSRYYDPETGRFVNADDIQVLDITKMAQNGLNLYSYCLNNPIKYFDRNGYIPINDYSQYLTTTKKLLQRMQATPLANVVNRIHLTKIRQLITNSSISSIFGNVSFSATTLYQNVNNGVFYAYSDIGNDITSYGVGVDLWGLAGLEIFAQSDYNLGFSINVGSFLHAGIQIGTSGVGLSIGININNTSYDLNVKIGLGTVAIAVVAVAAPILVPFFSFFAWLFGL